MPPVDGGTARRADTSRVFGPGSCRRGLIASGLATLAALLAGCASATVHPVATPAPAISPQLRREEQRVHAQVTTSLHRLADRNVRYGSIPRFIPQGGTPVNQVLDASPGHPAVSIEGEPIRLRLPGGSSLATMIGPYIPRRFQGTAVRQTPTTLTLTFTRARGALPISTRAFTIVDEQGTVLRPVPTTEGGATLPPTVPARGRFTLRFRLTLPIGNGTLRYAPPGRRHVVASWEFDVETD